MDNLVRERVQRLFNQNSELENRRRKAVQARIPSDPNAWQQMRDNFQAILLEDHAFSEQYEIEYALWQLHYKRIEELRATFNATVASTGLISSQNGMGRGGSDRVTKIRNQFKAFLTEATGFYHDLMLKIRAKYGLPLGYLSCDAEVLIPSSQDVNRSIELKKGLLSCHRCFIYLGDLARYEGLYGDGDTKALDFASAASYYMQAASLWPSSGNPHHQLAILASYSGDELVIIYRYFRSLAIESPFVTAKDNLIIAFEKNRQSYSQLLGGSKPSSSKSVSMQTARGRGKGDTRLQTKGAQSEVLRSFSIRVVRLNGILFTRTSLETFDEVFTAIRSDFIKLLSTGGDEECNFGTEASDCRLVVVRLIAILIFSIHHVKKEAENQSYAEILQRSVLLENAFSATFELVGLIIERCSLLNDPSVSYLLSGVTVFIEWLACNQDIAIGSGMEEKQTNARLFFWNHFINFLNGVSSRGVFLGEDEDETCFVNMIPYEEGNTANHLALPEDFELRGFVPLLPAQLFLDFSGKFSYGNDRNKEGKARMERIFTAGKALADVVRLRDEGLHFDFKLKKFVIGLEPQVSDTYVLTTSETEKENPILGRLNAEVLQPKPQLHVDTEEEDEEIVFKPFMAEKQDRGFISKQYSSEALVDEVNETKVISGNVAASFSDKREAYLEHIAFNTSLRPPVSVVNTNPLYMQSLPLNTSMWLSKQDALDNGMNDLNLFKYGPTTKPESRNYVRTFHPPAISDTFSLQPENGGGAYSLPMPQKLMPQKNPVSRPLRHMGPPPGFGSISSKTVDESVSTMSLKPENAVISQSDDYKWLDGYSSPAINRDVGYNSYVNFSGHGYHTIGKNTNSFGTVNLNGWPDHQLSEQLKVYQEQHDRLNKVNQQSAVMKQQYQGQSLREGFR